jgi:hypothetical protein
MDGLRLNKQDPYRKLQDIAAGVRLQTPAFVLCFVVAVLFFAAPLGAQVTISTSSSPMALWVQPIHKR